MKIHVGSVTGAGQPGCAYYGFVPERRPERVLRDRDAQHFSPTAPPCMERAQNMNHRHVDTLPLRADDLRYLLALARTGRLVAAASALGVDHTTVSRRISALEKVIGVRLAERGADGWELTDIGRTVAENARPIEEAIENVANAATGGDATSLRGTVRVTAPDGFGSIFVAPALTRIQQEHPQLNVELITATRELTLHQSRFDLAVAVGSPTGSRLVPRSSLGTRYRCTPLRITWPSTGCRIRWRACDTTC